MCSYRAAVAAALFILPLRLGGVALHHLTPRAPAVAANVDDGAAVPPTLNGGAYMQHFIVVPEHKLLFCYMEKVGCANFNELFRHVRSRYDPSQALGSPWNRNRMSDHGLSIQDVERILVDKNWHKAVFFREPVERFTSGFVSKCEGTDLDGAQHCRRQFGSDKVNFDTAVRMIAKVNSSDPEGPWDHSDVHFSTMASFCGGLVSTLQYYDTVKELRLDTSHGTVGNLLKAVGIDPNSVPHFDELFPNVHDGNHSKLGEPDAMPSHNTHVGDNMKKYFPADPKGRERYEALRAHYAADVDLFRIPDADWAMGQWHTTRSLVTGEALTNESIEIEPLIMQSNWPL